jgi:adenylate cyclase
MVENPRAERRLAAILAADVAGYSRLMGADEEGTLGRLKALRRELVDPKVAEHYGRIVKVTGDGMLAAFSSVVDAVRCAVALQQAMPERNAGAPEARRIEFRVGINLGDVIVEGDDLYGDGVNIAARIEALADPGGVLVSNTVHDQVRDRLPFLFEDLGEHRVKNIARPLRVYRIALTHPVPAGQARGLAADDAPRSPLSRIAGEGAERQRREAGEGRAALPLPDKPSIAVLPFANLSGDPGQEYFVDSMVEEITTAIARLPWLFVIARNSSFVCKGKPRDLRQVGRELGVRYVLEGSVRKAGNRVRGDRRPYLGRPFRRGARRHLRIAGPDGVERCERNRAEAAPIRDRARGAQANRQPRCLRSLSPRAGRVSQIYRRLGPPGD